MQFSSFIHKFYKPSHRLVVRDNLTSSNKDWERDELKTDAKLTFLIALWLTEGVDSTWLRQRTGAQPLNGYSGIRAKQIQRSLRTHAGLASV